MRVFFNPIFVFMVGRSNECVVSDCFKSSFGKRLNFFKRCTYVSVHLRPTPMLDSTPTCVHSHYTLITADKCLKYLSKWQWLVPGQRKSLVHWFNDGPSISVVGLTQFLVHLGERFSSRLKTIGHRFMWLLVMWYIESSILLDWQQFDSREASASLIYFFPTSWETSVLWWYK